MMIGAYKVVGAPVAQLTPGKNTRAYVRHPFRHVDCDVTRRLRLHDAAFLQKWAYSGGLLKLEQGGRINVHFTSSLPYATDKKFAPEGAKNGGAPCQSSNLHTHGLLVPPSVGSPTPTGMKDVGDFIIHLAAPKGRLDADACLDAAKNATHSGSSQGGAHAHKPMETIDYSIRIPAKKPIGHRQDPTATGFHPSGLFWMHPHPHGYSSQQLRGGTTSLITIGRLADYMKWEGPGATDRKNVREMLLKDAQLSLVDAASKTWKFENKYEPALCNANPAPADNDKREGECKAADGRVWTFTVNGLMYPRLSRDVEANESEIWRIANASPNITYRLSIRNKNDPGKRLQFEILAVDGVAVGNSAAAASARAERREEILLMPGSRAEIGIVHEPGTWVLTNEVVQGGADAWPTVKLAEIEWKAPATGGPVVAMKATASRMAAVVAGFTPKRDIDRSARLNAAPKTAASVPASICDLPSGHERVILFVKKPDDGPNGEVFGLIAGIRPVQEAGLEKLRIFKRTGPGRNPSDYTLVSARDVLGELAEKSSFAPAFDKVEFGDVCTKVGRDEIWVLENWTPEIHNFHIHQTRFRIADADSFGPSYFNWPEPPKDEKPEAAATNAAIKNFFSSTGVQGFAHHDSAPVPRGGAACNGTPATKDCQPGRVTVLINFNRDEQVGAFPYHCHILEHEDLGMMALVTVLPRDGQPQAAAASHKH